MQTGLGAFSHVVQYRAHDQQREHALVHATEIFVDLKQHTVCVESNNDQDIIQDGSKTVQESKPLHIRNRTGPESERIESFGIESGWIDQDFKEPEHNN